MIVTTKKSREELLRILVDYKKIIILGCGDCATLCNTGGEKEVEELKRYFEKEDKVIVLTKIIDTSCDERLIKRDLKKIPDSDCIVSLSFDIINKQPARNRTESSNPKS